ncbi:hypothetical protein Q7P37_006243 [Cladosporium fusiforme]
MAETSNKRPRDEGDDGGDEQPAKRFSVCNPTEMVAILVGPQEERFIIHKDLIAAKSKFFQAACSKRWKEGQEKTVRLPEVEGSVFKAYFTWVYSNTVDISSGDHTKEQDQDAQELIIDLYILADIIDDLALRMHTLRLMVTLDKCWHHTPSRMDTWVYRAKRSTFAKKLEEYPEQFVRELCLALMQQTTPDGLSQLIFHGKVEYVEAEVKRAGKRP